ncbi:MAG: carboxypeptidase-like regulatory domain-containing protein [Acidobacteria bacterium]|nr:carboxypeptidase-like regulatory domain-containing protein [Acidobacteriota bacterium]
MCKYAFRQSVVAVMLVLSLFAVAGAQEFRGSLSGNVTDPNGAVLPGATVEIKNVETNIASTVVTNEEGGFSFPLLQPGKYTLTVSSQGFTTAQRGDIEIRVADRLTLDIQMQTGLAETVNVIDTTVALEIGSVSAGTVIERKQISELPLIDGSPYQLATLAPGVSYTGNPAFTAPTSNGNLASFRTNGATGPNQITLDGSPNFAIDGAVGFSPPSEAVSQFKVQTTQFDAQQGYTANATVNVALKSGTNDFHGALFYFNRDRSRAANNFFANAAGQERAERIYHRGGGEVDGPVRIPGIYNGRDKTFFLFAYERLKTTDSEPQLYTVPTMLMRTGNLSEFLSPTASPNGRVLIYNPFSIGATGTANRTPFAGNIIPTALLNPVAVNYLNLYPEPNRPGLQNNFFSPTLRFQNYRSWVTRVDHNINSNHRLFFNYYHSFNPEDRRDWTQKVVNDFPVTRGIEFRTNDGAVLGYTATLSSTMVLDVRGNMTRFVQERRPSGTFDPANLGFTPAALATMRGFQYLPRFDIRTYDQVRPIRSTLGAERSDFNEGFVRPLYVASVQPTLTAIFGNHTAKFGYDGRVLRENFSGNGYQGGRFTFDGTFTTITTTTTTNSSNATNHERNRNLYGRDVAAFLLGLPVSGSNSRIENSVNYNVQSVYHGFFVQDDWRVSPKLTFNLGLRYDLELGITERFNRLSRGFDLETASPIDAAARAAFTTIYNANQARFAGSGLTPTTFAVRGGFTYADENNRAAWDADRSNLQPRFGAAYQLNDKTVLRGGFGIFTSAFRIPSTLSDIANNSLTIQPGFSGFTPFVPSTNSGRTFVASLDNPFPSGLRPSAGTSLGLLTNFAQTLGASDAPIIPNERKNAKFARLIVGIQRELPGQFIFEANFVSSWGYDLAVNRNINFVPAGLLGTDPTSAETANTFLTGNDPNNPFRNLLNGNLFLSDASFNTGTTVDLLQLVRPYPQFGDIWIQEYDGTNRYNSLQLQGQKRFSRSFSLTTSYTYSRLKEKISYLNASDEELEERFSTDDRPHRFTFAGVYELPFGRGRTFGRDMNRIVNAFIGGWQLNGTYEWQSGEPLLFGDNFYYAGDINALSSRVGQYNEQGQRYGVDIPAFDTAGWLELPSTGLRNVPSTLPKLRNQPFKSINLSLSKNFNFNERMRLQFRAEALNALNYVYFGGINLADGETNANFGRVNNQRNLPRDIQLGLKFTF